MKTPYGHVMYRIIDPADLLVGRLRAQAVKRLDLKAGDSVIDAGCGLGNSFPYLLEAVGPSGHILGIEIDPFMASRAQRRIEQNGWKNVQVIQADAQSAAVRGQFEGLLMFAAHEILTSPLALDNLTAAMKENARVVAFGAKQTHNLVGLLMNPLLRIISKRWLPFSAPIGTIPWKLLETRVDKLTVEERLFGIFYLVSGSLSRTKP